MENVGEIDRAARLAFGAALIGAGALRRGPWRLALLAGAGLLYTAYTRHCPLSAALGVDTHAEPERTLVGTEKPVIDEASEDSFPASDAPSWTAGASV